MISLPVVVSPVKATLAIRGLVARVLPISTPIPLMTLITPSGTRSAMISISTKIEAGVGPAGLRTTQFPAGGLGRVSRLHLISGSSRG